MLCDPRNCKGDYTYKNSLEVFEEDPLLKLQSEAIYGKLLLATTAACNDCLTTLKGELCYSILRKTLLQVAIEKSMPSLQSTSQNLNLITQTCLKDL